ALGVDRVHFGLVASLNRPGGNVTGVNFLTADLGEKALGLIHELVPNVAVGAMLVNPNNPNGESLARKARETAPSLGLQLRILNAGTAQEIDTAFATIVEQRIGLLSLGADPFFVGRRDQFVALAARHAIPVIYYVREFVTAGGLMSYGTSVSDAYRRAGVYTGKILKGAKPADLPVEQWTRFEFVINLKPAKALGVQIPDRSRALAGGVMECWEGGLKMNLPRRNFLHLTARAAALPAASRFAFAQAYPTRPVRIIAPTGPAGAPDIIARLIGPWLSQR